MTEGHDQLVMCAPLRIEERAVARGAAGSDARIIRIGMGPKRARQAGAALPSHGPVAVIGVAGGLVRELRVPAVVVASRIVTDDGDARDCPAATEVAERLAAAGLDVHVGTIVSVPKIVSGEAARAALAAQYDALACDMESGYLASTLSADRSFVVVRVLSDSPTEALLHPGVVPRGIAALRTVRQAAAVLCTWAPSP